MNLRQQALGILIFGDGLDAWTSAAFLARKLRNGSVLITVRPAAPALAGAPCALSSTPSLNAFHQELGLDERDLMRYCRGTFSLGAQFFNWAPNGDYLVPWGETGAPIDGIAFHHFWLKNGGPRGGAYDAYSLAAQAGRAGKFSHPSDDSNDIRSTYDYGFHLDSERYADYMRKYALHYGVRTANSPLRELILDGAAGLVKGAVFENGETIKIGLVLNCADAHESAVGGMNRTTWRDYAAAARLDRIACTRADANASPSLTRIAAQAHGWTAEIPLQDCICRTIMFAQGSPPAEVTESFPVSRRRRTPWAGNVVAVGGSAAQLDPLLAPQLDILTAGLRHLTDLLPAGESGFEAAEYNRIMENVFDRCNDFQTLQYWIAETRGGHTWAAGAESTQTPELARKRRQFESRGRMVQYDEETFDETMWIASFLGGGALPRRYDPLTDNLSQADVAATLNAMRKTVAGAAEAMPGQMDYLRRANAIAAGREAK